MTHPLVILAAAAGSSGTTDPLPGSWGPSKSFLPGSDKFQQLAQGLEWWALALALVGLVIGAAVWALGAHSQNLHQSVAGRRAVLVCGLAALVIGAGPTLIRFFYSQGAGASF